jgi:spore germination protein KB
MEKITNFQLYCLLILLTLPIAFIEQPHRLIHIVYNNAWLTFIPVFFTGTLLILMYTQIINKSSQPFPLLLDEHLGKTLGRILGSAYIFIFILTCSFNLRVFIEFMKMIVLPATPISIFIGVILFVGFIAIKLGLGSIARTSEILVWIGLTFSAAIILIPLMDHFHLERLRPIAYMNYISFGQGVFIATLILGKMMPILSLAFFIPDKKRAAAIMYRVLFTYAPFLAFTTLAVIVTLGTYPARNFVFPTFNMIRLARIGVFIQNLDIVFVAVWILGVFGAVTISWWMACFTTQKVFNLQDYRFLAAPSSVIIGILSLILSRNNLEVLVWSLSIMPYIFAVFFILIPFFIFIICLFKDAPDLSAPESANSPEPLHKQGVAG